MGTWCSNAAYAPLLGPYAYDWSMALGIVKTGILAESRGRPKRLLLGDSIRRKADPSELCRNAKAPDDDDDDGADTPPLPPPPPPGLPPLLLLLLPAAAPAPPTRSGECGGASVLL